MAASATHFSSRVGDRHGPAAARCDVAGDLAVDSLSECGEIALLASTRYENPVAGSNDAVDQFDCKPDFQVLMYPGGLNNLSSVAITKDTPPAFLCCTYTDRSTISANLASFYLLLKSAGVPAALHIYNSGGQGWGVRPTGKPVASWPDRLMDWLADRGLVPPK